MSTEQQARSLMNRHHHVVKNRQQTMLGRSSAEIGVATTKYLGEQTR
jgi:hypothetical protein